MPNFVVKDVELIKQITIKDFDSFVNHDKTFDVHVDKVFGRSLFSLFDGEWRTMRNTLSPIFTSSKMKMMFGMVSECAHDFINHFEKKVGSGKIVIEADDVFARYTVDGIWTAALGFKGDCIENQDSSLYKLARRLVNFDFATNIKILLAAIAKPLYVLFGFQLLREDERDFFKKVVIDAMNEREAKNISRPDIIQLLLQTRKGQLGSRDNNDNENDLANFSANIEYDVAAKDQKVKKWTDHDFMAQGFVC